MASTRNSKLVTVDPNGYSEKKYAMAPGFHPGTDVERFSYTGCDVLKYVYNHYSSNEYQVFGYYTDWAQYDGRRENQYEDANCGRNADLFKVDPTAYDKIILGFVGVLGDKGEKQWGIINAADQFGTKTDEATFLDPWGDVLSYDNVGFEGWVSDDVKAMYNETSAQGILGGLRDLKKKKKTPICGLPSVSVAGP